MIVTFDDPNFQLWANSQLPKFVGPTRYVLWMYLLRNLWEKDPSVRRTFRRPFAPEWTEPAYEQEFTDHTLMPKRCS